MYDLDEFGWDLNIFRIYNDEDLALLRLKPLEFLDD